MPKWIDIARKYLGTTEIKGSRHNKLILRWWTTIRAPFTDDETPWCSAFVGGVLEECGIQSSRNAAARSYLKWGVELKQPVVGAIVVFWRGSPQGWNGHVGFVVGRDKDNNLMVLGGNQGDQVNIRPFAPNRVLSYRWPLREFAPTLRGWASLPVLNSEGKVSENEA